ncbi:MAG: hypothetical protein JW986_03235 [Methanotrichaceae archaeon]|nr:hypothetical protein [Methanotrichaceae archaeon]
MARIRRLDRPWMNGRSPGGGRGSGRPVAEGPSNARLRRCYRRGPASRGAVFDAIRPSLPGILHSVRVLWQKG